MPIRRPGVCCGDPRTDFFPLFAPRLLVSMAATQIANIFGNKWLWMLPVRFSKQSVVVRFTSSHRGPTRRPRTANLFDTCGRLCYGTLDSSQLWIESSVARLVCLGLVPAGCIQESFYPQFKDVYFVAHADPMTLSSQAYWRNLCGWTAKERQRMSLMLNHREHGEVLGQRSLAQDVYTWASDPKHSYILVEELGLRQTNDSDIPLVLEDRFDVM